MTAAQPPDRNEPSRRILHPRPKEVPALKKWLFLALTLSVMAAIFALSAQPGAQSYALSEQVMQQLQQGGLAPAAPGWFSADFHAELRKWAHVWLYGLLGLFAALTVCAFWAARRPLRGWRAVSACAGLTLGVCLLYAAGDELHQYFVPGRACLASDLAVDALGFAPCALAVCAVWAWRAARRP